MRNLFCGLAAAAMLCLVYGVHAQTTPQAVTPAAKSAKKAAVTPQKKAPAKAGTARPAATKAGTAVSRTPSATKSGKSGKKGVAKSAPAPTWRSRQLAPTPDRYKEIQQALAAKGYLKPEDATGNWNDNSTEALKRFQADQKLDSTGKINALSLIALGLGPKHATEPAATPAVPNPPEAK